MAHINRELIGKAEALDSAQRVVLDMDSTEIPVYGQQENSAYNGRFESTCYHPLLLFNREGDCLAAKLRPGNVHSADGWEDMLLAAWCTLEQEFGIPNENPGPIAHKGIARFEHLESREQAVG